MTTRQQEFTQVDDKTQAGLFKKLSLIMSDMKVGIENRGYNESQKYNYKRVEDVKTLARQAMVKHGVAFWVSVDDATQRSGQSGKGAGYTDTLLSLTFHLADVDTGASITIPWKSEARDYADKGLNKSITAAVKYFLLNQFLPSDPDEADADAETIESVYVYTCDAATCEKVVETSTAMRVSQLTGGQVYCSKHFAEWKRAQKAEQEGAQA